MAQPLKHRVIGLVSGGKDSCFNMMHCVANGHEIVALATLTPEPGIDELDSHLYQSVGTSLLPLIAKSMRLPLFTKTITGTAVNKGAEYGSRLRGGKGSGTIGDETEDLTELLMEVMAAYPDVTALSTGAILSTYQRLRMEHVCQRLGLTSLAYMWQGNQATLVDTMLSSGLEPVLVKVAGVGLEVEDVGRKLRDVRARLGKLERIYGSHVAGEGGEYETITTDGPMFYDRLSLDETTTVVTDPSPVAHMLIQSASLVEKPGHVVPSPDKMRELLNLPEDWQQGVMDEETSDLVDVGLSAASSSSSRTPLSQTPTASKQALTSSVIFAKRERWFAASITGSLTTAEISEDVKQSFEALAERLSSESLSLPLHTQHVTFLLSSMSLFPTANAAYKEFFGTSPPSRACVAVDLPPGVNVRIEVVGFDDAVEDSDALTGGRSALHVQGVSYWAPANIGPYSQSVMVDSRLTIAGQIPLIPATLTLPSHESSHSSPYPVQAALALQHVRRIVAALRSGSSTGGGWEGWTEGVIGWWAKPQDTPAAEAISVLKAVWSEHADRNECRETPVIFLQALELPKGALAEWQVNMHTGRPALSGNPPDDDDDELEGVFEIDVQGTLRVESCQPSSGAGKRTLVFSYNDNTLVDLITIARLQAVLQTALAVKVYHPSAVDADASFSKLVETYPGVCFTAVPVLSIHDREGKAAAIALDISGI